MCYSTIFKKIECSIHKYNYRMSLLSYFCLKPECKCDKYHCNRPKFPDMCRWGVGCYLPNCWYSHPAGRRAPVYIEELCRYMGSCCRTTCKYIHPEQDIEQYRSTGKCKYGSNCTFKECKKTGHDGPPIKCRYGASCRKANLAEGACPFSH